VTNRKLHSIKLDRPYQRKGFKIMR